MRIVHLIGATIIAAALLSGPNSASADTAGCVSRHEYGRVVKGMTMVKVNAIFDTTGAETGLGAPNKLYYYDTCTGRGVVQVAYNQRDRVVSKGARFF